MPAKYDKRQTAARKSREKREKRFSENDAGTTSVNIGTSSSKPAFPGATPPFKRKGEKGTKEKKKPAFLKAKEEESRAAASVMRMALDYKRSVRKRRLAAIRGWREALALGAAGLAGLAPMKVQAHEYDMPHGTTHVSQDDLQYPAFKAGYEDGKASPRVPGDDVSDKELAASRMYSQALIQASRKGYMDQGQMTRDFIQGWLDGYVTTHATRTPAPEVKQAQAVDTDNQEEMEALGDAEVMLDQAWQQLPPKYQNQLQASEKAWEKRRDQLPSDQQYQFIKDRVRFLQSVAYSSSQHPKPDQDFEPQIKASEAELGAKWNNLSADLQAKLKADNNWQNLQTDFNFAPPASAEKLQASKKVIAYLDSYSGGGTPAPAQQQGADIDTKIKDLRAAIVGKWNKLPDNVKAQINSAPDLKNLETAFNQAPKGSDEKLQALQKVSDYLDSQSTGGEGNLDLTATPAPASATSTDHNYRVFYLVRDKHGVHGKSRDNPKAPYATDISAASEEAARANLLQQEPNAVQIEINQMPDSD
jgi:hypothetical protein